MWQEYKQDVFGDPFFVGHDGADFTELNRRWQADPTVVRAMILDGLRSGDDLAADSIAALARRGAHLDECLDPLREALVEATRTFRVRVADALFAITGDQAWGREMLPILQSDSESDRYATAIALRVFRPAPGLVDALEVAGTDEHYLVRIHSAETLLAFAGRSPDASADPAVFALLRSRNPRRRRRAFQQLALAARRAMA